MISQQLKKKRIQFLDENLLAPNSSSGLSESLPVGSSHEIISVVFSSPQHRQTVSDSSSLEQSESERSLSQYRQPAFLVANFNHFLKCVIRNPLKHWQHWVASCYSIFAVSPTLVFDSILRHSCRWMNKSTHTECEVKYTSVYRGHWIWKSNPLQADTTAKIIGLCLCGECCKWHQ